MIASWEGTIRGGRTSQHVSAFWDVLPTLCELSGAEIPEDTDGISFAPTLKGEAQPKHEFLYWEFPAYQGQQAVRMGDWKALRRDIFKWVVNVSDDLHHVPNMLLIFALNGFEDS